MGRNLPIIIAIISGLVGGILIYSYVQKREKEARQLRMYLKKQMVQQEKMKEEMARLRSLQRVTTKVPVIVAVKPIPSGEIITSEMVKEKMVPKEAKIPTSAGSLDAVVGKVSRVDIAKGEQIILRHLVSPELMKRQLIPPGTRLVSIQVEQLSLFRFLRPGDKVDISVIFTLPPSQVVNVGLFSDVEVRAINGLFSYAPPPQPKRRSKILKRDRKAESSGIRVNPDKGVLTFALPPKEAAILFMASQFGRITIYPRANLDADKEKLPPVTVETVLQYAMPQVLAKAKQFQQRSQVKEEMTALEPKVKAGKSVRRIKIRKGAMVVTKELGDDVQDWGLLPDVEGETDLSQGQVKEVNKGEPNKETGSRVSKETVKTVVKEVLKELKDSGEDIEERAKKSDGGAAKRKESEGMQFPPNLEKYLNTV